MQPKAKKRLFMNIFLFEFRVNVKQERVCVQRPSTIIKIIIIYNLVKMLPFHQQIKNQNYLQSYNQVNFNFPVNFSYPKSSFAWNIDYSGVQNQSFFPPSNYYFIPNFQFGGLDQIKEANLPTRPSQSLEVLQLQRQQKPAQVENQKEIKNEKEKGASLKIQQKYGRNILSNIFHVTIKKILSPQFSQNILKGIQKNKLSITLQQFRQRLEEKTKNMKGYINMKFIKGLKIGRPIGATKLDIEFRKLLRILCRIYNHNYHIPYIFHTTKIKRESRGLHLECLRKLSKKNKK